MTRRRAFNEQEVHFTIVPLYQRHTIAEIARMFDCDPGTVKRALERNGYKTRGPGERPPERKTEPLPVVFDASARDWTPYHLTDDLDTTRCGLELPAGFEAGHKMRRLCANCERTT